MQPLAEFQLEARRAVDCVIMDIDDTLTSAGRLPAVAYQAVERLHQAGYRVVPVTGRPAGWCDLIARLWPVDGVVGENGAFYFRCEPQRGMLRVFQKPEAERHADRERLNAIAAEVLAAVPGARIAADQQYRETDLAIDYAEDGPLLCESEIDAILACFRRAGATAKVSSIHVNGWFGSYDKLAMTLRLFSDSFGIDLEAVNERAVYIGDSPNDEPMFAFFRNAIAVANFTHFAHRVRSKPRWITAEPGGAGFAEAAQALLSSR